MDQSEGPAAAPVSKGDTRLGEAVERLSVGLGLTVLLQRAHTPKTNKQQTTVPETVTRQRFQRVSV